MITIIHNGDQSHPTDVSQKQSHYYIRITFSMIREAGLTAVGKNSPSY